MATSRAATARRAHSGLTADLGTDKRRHGDRSTRDDDRDLFLQLFSAAQDAFYLSWLGADPRDGSTRASRPPW